MLSLLLRAGAVLLLAASLAPAAPLPAGKLAELQTGLRSKDERDQIAAIKDLDALESLPDELVPDIVDVYIASRPQHGEDKMTPPANQEEAIARLQVLGRTITTDTSLISIWPKMNPAALAKAIRPLVADPVRRKLVGGLVSENKKLAKELLPDLLTILADPKIDAGAADFVCKALRTLGPEAKTAAPALRELLHNPSDMVRNEAANTLAVIGTSDPAAISTPAK